MRDDFSTEISILRGRFDKAPESRIFAPLADAYRKNGDVERAIEICEKGLENYPDYASAHVILGKCFYDLGATERSRAEFERVVEIDPENMVALKYIGDILMSEGDRDKAVECYRRILAIDPTNEEVSGTLKGLEDEFREREIDLDKGEKVRTLEQPAELATLTLAGIYAAQGYYNKALKIYREILEKEPENAEAKEMAEKIKSMIDSSEHEVEEAFDDGVMTISVEDVSEEIVEATAGPGAPSREEGEESESDVEEGEKEGEGGRPRKGSVLGDEEELEAVARELEEADREDKPDEKEEQAGSVEGEVREGMDNFKRWLQGMQSDSGEDDG